MVNNPICGFDGTSRVFSIVHNATIALSYCFQESVHPNRALPQSKLESSSRQDRIDRSHIHLSWNDNLRFRAGNHIAMFVYQQMHEPIDESMYGYKKVYAAVYEIKWQEATAIKIRARATLREV